MQVFQPLSTYAEIWEFAGYLFKMTKQTCCFSAYNGICHVKSSIFECIAFDLLGGGNKESPKSAESYLSICPLTRLQENCKIHNLSLSTTLRNFTPTAP